MVDSNGPVPHDDCEKLVDIESLTLETPSRGILIVDLSLEIKEKDNLLITGPSGCGKTSLLRAMAGLWTTGRGNITFYGANTGNIHQVNSDELLSESSTRDVITTEESYIWNNRYSRGIFFLPQRPYMVLGTLREQLLYPTWAEIPVSDGKDAEQNGFPPFLLQPQIMGSFGDRSGKPTTRDLLKVLEDVRLGYILSRVDGLDSRYEWSSVLSLGEQQRLAFARLLLAKPRLVLLDESTSALDEGNEAHLYNLIEAAGITYVSIGHRRTLYNYHRKVLHISSVDQEASQRNWNVKTIGEKAKSSLSAVDA